MKFKINYVLIEKLKSNYKIKSARDNDKIENLVVEVLRIVFE